jgi:hypothetical protein
VAGVVVAALVGAPKREGADDAGGAPKFGRLVATLLAGIPKPVKPAGAAEVAGAIPKADGVAVAPAKVRGAAVEAAG